MSTFISGVIVASVGIYFTNSYNAQQAKRDEVMKEQQLRLSKLELVHQFVPRLTGSEREKKIAIIVISTLGEAELATNIASLDQSRGATDALHSLTQVGNAHEKQLAEKALQSYPFIHYIVRFAAVDSTEH